MSDEKAKHNHTGQQPTDIPSEKLIHPPQKRGSGRSTGQVVLIPPGKILR
ncbi:hypothetical protein [Arcticibacter sp. MXS-1]